MEHPGTHATLFEEKSLDVQFFVFLPWFSKIFAAEPKKVPYSSSMCLVTAQAKYIDS
jgi:hypothetical protein